MRVKINCVCGTIFEMEDKDYPSMVNERTDKWVSLHASCLAKQQPSEETLILRKKWQDLEAEVGDLKLALLAAHGIGEKK